MLRKTIVAVDLFAGAGGTSTGLIEAGNIEYPLVKTDEKSRDGQLITLAYHGFFDHERRLAEIAKELDRWYVFSQKNIARDLLGPLEKLIVLKVLQRKEAGNGWVYTLADGAKDRIREAFLKVGSSKLRNYRVSPHVSLNSARSFVGKAVNLHLVDGITLVNVRLEGVVNRRLLVRGCKPRAQLLFVPLVEVSAITVVPVMLSMLKEAL